jgi:hypothetical protein
MLRSIMIRVTLRQKNRSRSAPLNEIEIRARLDAFAKELAQAERDRAKH